MVPKDLDNLIQKYLDGTCTEAERKLVDDLYSSLGGETGKRGKPAIDNIDRLEARILQNIEAGIIAGPEEEDNRWYLWRYTGIAASVVFLLAAGYYFLKPEQPRQGPILAQETSSEFRSVENSTAETKRVILPDGSIVEMFAASRIRFSSDPNASTRELFLEGEAYFDVAHDKERPFYVYAGNVVTKVLGTSFIVRAPGKEQKVTVSVKTGKVSVYSRNTAHKKTVLTPNQEAVYDQMTDLVATQEVPVQGLKDDIIPITEMHFEETPIPQVFRALTETYAIDILFDEKTLSDCVLTSGFFEEGLYDRIDVICTAIGATYTVVDARIVIESKGCNLKTD